MLVYHLGSPDQMTEERHDIDTVGYDISMTLLSESPSKPEVQDTT